jgi:heme-degrading monooxygenase HmoA
MLKRIWHGYTTPGNADVYENLLKTEIFPGIAAKNVKGYKSIELLRRNLNDEVEFITIMEFDSLEAVKEFAGENYAHGYVLDSARKVLKRFDEQSQHYELREKLSYRI